MALAIVLPLAAAVGACAEPAAPSHLMLSVTADVDATRPATVYYDTDERAPGGVLVRARPSTRIDLSVREPVRTVAIPYSPGDGLRVRVDGSPTRGAPTSLACELRDPSGRVVDNDTSQTPTSAETTATCHAP